MIHYKSPIILCLIVLLALCCKPGERPLQQGKIAQPEKGTPISNMLKVDTAEIALLMKKGSNLIDAGYLDSAMIYLYEALHLSQQINDHISICRALFSLGVSYERRKDFNKSNTFIFRALYYLNLSKNTEEIKRSMIYSAIGLNYFHTSQYDSSLYYFYGSLAELKKAKLRDTPLIITAYIYIAAALEPIDEDYTRALSYMQQAKTLAATYQKDTFSLARACYSTAILYRKMDHTKNNSDSAIAYLNEALHYYRQLASKNDIINAYSDIASTYLEKKDLGQTVLYLDSALTTDSMIGNNHRGLNAIQGDVLYVQGKLKQALPYYLKVIHQSETNLDAIAQMNIYAKLAELYDSIGKGHLAYRYLRKHIEINKELLMKEERATINHLEVKFRSSEKDAELATKNWDL